MKPSNILLVQTGAGGVSLCSKVLPGEGIERNRDYLADSNTAILRHHVTEDKPQLLIINSFQGDFTAVKKLVEELRTINPQLIVLLVDCNVGTGSDETFEETIDMLHPDWYKALASKIRDFQKGDLRRTTRGTAAV